MFTKGVALLIVGIIGMLVSFILLIGNVLRNPTFKDLPQAAHGDLAYVGNSDYPHLGATLKYTSQIDRGSQDIMENGPAEKQKQESVELQPIPTNIEEAYEDQVGETVVLNDETEIMQSTSTRHVLKRDNQIEETKILRK